MKAVAVVQARMGSSRCPGKTLAPMDGERTLLDCTLDALEDRRAGLSEIVVATSRSPGDDAIEDHVRRRGLRVIRGPEQDVLARLLLAVEACRADPVVRVCADNPLIDPHLVGDLAGFFEARRVDYAGFVTSDGVPSICTPSGLFVECVSPDALRRLADGDPPPEVTEHVTLGIYTNPDCDCTWLPMPAWADRPWLRLTCDTSEDLRRLRAVFSDGPIERPRRELVEWLSGVPELRGAMAEANRRDGKPAVRVTPDARRPQPQRCEDPC